MKDEKDAPKDPKDSQPDKKPVRPREGETDPGVPENPGKNPPSGP